MNSCPRHAVVARRKSPAGQGARGITKSMRWCGLAGLVCAFGRAPALAEGFLHAPKAGNGGPALYLTPRCGARAEALCPFGSRDSPWRRSGVPASPASLTAVEKGHVTRARRLASAQRQCVPQPTAPRTALSAGTDGAGRAERDASASASASETLLAGLTRDVIFMRVFAWASFAFLLSLVQPFYGVMAGTFVMSFVGNSVVHMWERSSVKLQAWADARGLKFVPRPTRKMLSVVYCCMLLAVLSIGSCITVPIIYDSWRYLKTVLLSDNPYVELANSLYYMAGPEATARVESLLGTVFGEPSASALRSLQKVGEAPALTWQLQQSLKGYVAASLPIFNKILKGGSQFFAQFMASLLFSFICIYDAPRLSRGVQRLGSRESAIAPVYNEVAPRVGFFGQLVGKSLEAQLMIALWNTLLTTGGLWLLGVSGAAFFSVLVFVCSFIPLLGVLLSTMPMCVVALGEFGVYKMFQVWLMVFVVHVVEAYFLNPQIYSSKLKLHPLLVLVALYVTVCLCVKRVGCGALKMTLCAHACCGCVNVECQSELTHTCVQEHCFGIGALFLAVPVTVFVIQAVLGGISKTRTNGQLEI